MTELLSELLAALQARHIPGDLLGRLHVEIERQMRLRAYLRRYLIDPPSGHGNRDLIGAALFLTGVIAFRDAPATADWSYETIQACIDPERTFGDRHIGVEMRRWYDHIEAGAERMWGIRLLQGRAGHRLFQGTMLFHSGAGDAMLVELARCAEGLGGWERIRHATVGDLADKLPDLPLKAHQRRALASEDARVAVAERLQELAGTVERVVSLGVVAADPELTLAAIREAGFGDAFDLEDMDLLQRLITILFPPSAVGPDAPPVWRWCWDFAGVSPGLALEVPKRLPASLFPAGTDRVAVHCGGDRIFFGGVGATFARSDDRGRLPTAPPATIVALARVGARPIELELATVGFPSEGYAIFHADTGALLHSAPAGTKVMLVPEAGRLIVPPPAFARCGAGWLGTMPGEPVELSDDLVLAPVERRIAFDVSNGNEVAGLVLEGASVCRCLPRVLALGVDRGSVKLSVPGAEREIPLSRFRLGRIQMGEAAGPGRYRIEVRLDHRFGRTSWFLLPEDVVRLEIRDDFGSTEIQGSGEAIATFTAEGREGTGFLQLETRGPVAVAVVIRYRGQVWRGTWRVQANPMAAQLDLPDGHEIPLPVRREHADARLLRGGGGVRVFGTPASSVEVTLGSRTIAATIGGRGTVLVPLSDLVVGALPSSVILQVRFPNGRLLSGGHFVDGSNALPSARVDADTIRIQYKAQSGEVSMKVVAAWAPWEPAEYVPVERQEAEGRLWYVASRASFRGPVQVRLVERRSGGADIPLTGMKLVQFAGDCPEDMDPLQRALWHASDDLLHRLGERLDADNSGDIIRELLDRFREDGTRWFKAADILLPELAPRIGGVAITRWRVLAMLVPQPGDRDRLAWLDGLELPLLWIRFTDLGSVLGRVHFSAVEARAGALTGLQVPIRRWYGQGPAEYRTYVHMALRPDEYEVLRQPGDRVPDVCDSPRFAALLEAHCVLQGDPAFVPEPVPAPRSYLRENRLSERTIALDMEINVRTAAVHTWRRGRPADIGGRAWVDRTHFLLRQFPRLFDFWLNAHAAREFP